jgi:transcriptional regulator with XRE-family HTH domain
MAVTELLDVAAAIAARVRACRTDRGWTLDELAARSGISRRMLVNVEQGSTNPSIATLLRISDALGVGLPSLVDVAWSPALRITRAGRAPVLWRGPSGGQAMLVAGSEPPDVVELWEWTLAPGERHAGEAPSAGTRELLLVLEGQVELQVGQKVEVSEWPAAGAPPAGPDHGRATSIWTPAARTAACTPLREQEAQ